MENTINDYRVKVTVQIYMIVCKKKKMFYSYTYNLQFNIMGQDILEGFKAEIYSTGFVKVLIFFICTKCVILAVRLFQADECLVVHNSCELIFFNKWYLSGF